MYLPYWALLVAFSVISSVVAFIWAHRSGQFTDQERAAHLALNEEYINSTSGKMPSVPAGERCLLSFLFGIIFVLVILSFFIIFYMAV